MPRRILAAGAALLLAVLGAVLLISYVNGADARARDGEDLASVLVVGADVAPGTAADALAGSVSVQQVPSRLVAPGAVTDLADVAGQVTTAALLPGDQLVAGRFADPTTLAPAGTVLRPDGLVEVTVGLEPQRALGGSVRAGDTVTVQITDERPGEGGGTEYSPARVFTGVLVTRVEGDAEDPTVPVMVTLAFTPEDAVWAVTGFENTNVWLSLEQAAPYDSSTDSTTTTVQLGDDS
jgi:pilus assembly protein CpaB